MIPAGESLIIRPDWAEHAATVAVFEQYSLRDGYQNERLYDALPIKYLAEVTVPASCLILQTAHMLKDVRMHPYGTVDLGVNENALAIAGLTLYQVLREFGGSNQQLAGVLEQQRQYRRAIWLFPPAAFVQKAEAA